MQAVAERPLVAEEQDREGFDRLSEEWDAALDLAGRPEPFHRHAFLAAWHDTFAPDARLRLFLARDQGRLIAGLLLLEDQPWLYGVRVRRLRAPANVHSNRFDALCVPGGESGLKAIWAQVRATCDFDLVEIPDVPENGAARRLLDFADSEGLGVEQWESMRTPCVPLEGGFGAVWARLDAHFRQNMRRRRRRLEQRGKVELERVCGGRSLERYLEEGFALERAGWKGRGRTAVGCDAITRGFYAEVARREALAGRLSLYFLRLDGRPAAFQYGLQSSATYWLPKIAYDETLGDCSPGQLLTEEVLKDCAARGVRELDFLGPGMAWKREWTSAERIHHWLYIFNATARARAVRRLKFWAAPRIREVCQWKP